MLSPMQAEAAHVRGRYRSWNEPLFYSWKAEEEFCDGSMDVLCFGQGGEYNRNDIMK